MSSPENNGATRIHPEITEPIAVSEQIDGPWFEKPAINAVLGFLMEADELACRAVAAVKRFVKPEELKGVKIVDRY